MRGGGSKRGPTSADKVLGLLSLFTAEKPVWSPESAARRLRVSLATSYRYFNTLVVSGMLEKFRRNQYVLGPAIVEFDRKVRAADPVLKLAQPVMVRLLRRLREPAAILLCRYYRQKVMCSQPRCGTLQFPMCWFRTC
jgi:DNA-binding IclR family transcriptional regulator